MSKTTPRIECIELMILAVGDETVIHSMFVPIEVAAHFYDRQLLSFKDWDAFVDAFKLDGCEKTYGQRNEGARRVDDVWEALEGCPGVRVIRLGYPDPELPIPTQVSVVERFIRVEMM